MLNRDARNADELILFLAGSSDVGDACLVAVDTHRKIGLSTTVPFGTYRYTFDREYKKSDISRQQQQAIPHPVDAGVVGVLCLFGERFGTPINDFEPYLKDIEWATQPFCEGGAHLVLDWTADAVDRGGFPLTGTAYEALTVIGHNRSINPDDPRHIPLGLIFCADDDTILSEADPIDASWGWRTILNEKQKQLDSNELKPSEFDKWKSDTYRPQLQQLSNFLRFLNESNRFIEPERDIATSLQDVGEKVKAFYRNSFDLKLAEDPHPVKGLDVFDVSDAEIFFGRDTEMRTAERKLDDLYGDPQRPNLFGVSGQSGLGKSSFLRAGLIGKLLNDTHRSAVISVPAILGCDGVVEEPLSSGLANLIARIQCALPTAPNPDEATIKRELSQLRDEGIIERATIMVQTLVERHVRSPLRFVLAMDQLEVFAQVLDPGDMPQPEDTASARLAHGAFCVLRALAKHERILIAFTALQDVLPRLEQEDAFGKDLALGTSISLPPIAASTLASVAEELFAHIRIGSTSVSVRFEPQLRERLEDMVGEMASSRESGAGATMPLFSIMLERLYDHILPELTAIAQKIQDTPDKSAFDRVAKPTDGILLAYQDCEEVLRLPEAISDLVRRAIERTEQRVAQQLASFDDHFDTLLKNLVAVRRRRGVEFEPELRDALLPRIDNVFSELVEAFTYFGLLSAGSSPELHRFRHIAVVRQWPFAADWLKRNSVVFRYRESLRERLTIEGQKEGGLNTYLSSPSDADARSAAAVLEAFRGSWSRRSLTSTRLSKADIDLREFCLAILRRRPDLAAEQIEEAKDPQKLAVHLAADYLDQVLLKSVLTTSPQLAKTRDGDRRSLLYSLAFAGESEMITDVLNAIPLEGRAELAASEDSNGWQAIHAAATNGHLEAFRCLVNAGADPSSAGQGDMTPLHLAAKSGQVEMCRALVGEEFRLSAFVQSSRGLTPIHEAAAADEVDVVEMLLAGVKQSPPEQLITPPDGSLFHISIRSGSIRTARWLLDMEMVDVEGCDSSGLNPLHTAVTRHDLAATRFLIEEAEADPTTRTQDQAGATALHIAVRAANSVVLDQLLSLEGINVNIGDRNQATPLMWAVESKNDAAISRLLEHPEINVAATDKLGRSPMHLANARSDGTLMLRLMQKPPKDLNEQMAEGWTPLLLAAPYIGRDNLDELLLDESVAFNDISDSGYTLLNGLVADQRMDIDNWLESLVADPRFEVAKNVWSTSVPDILMSAPKHFKSIVAIGKFDLSTPNRRGWTCLHTAAAMGDMQLISELRDRFNVDPALRDLWGRTALDLVPRILEEVAKRYLAHEEDPA